MVVQWTFAWKEKSAFGAAMLLLPHGRLQCQTVTFPAIIYDFSQKIFLTQQYRLFSNYSASLQVNMCWSDYTRIIITRLLLLLGLGM
jgi:hypothetical protein